jgi:hypothetical protein
MYPFEAYMRLHDGGEAAHAEEVAAESAKKGAVLALPLPSAHQILTRYIILFFP